MERLYFDNAATSWPKPPTVLKTLNEYYEAQGIAASRSNYRMASGVARQITQVRRQCANLIDAKNANEIAFSYSGTDSLNTAIFGTLKPGDHVVTTVIEHSSTLRPLRFLESERDISVSRIECDARGFVQPSEIKNAVRDDTRLVVVSHASNVTGKVQDVRSIGEICSEAGVMFLLDAAQTLGQLPIDVSQFHCQMLSAPGHKGVLGPLGTGILFVDASIEGQVLPLRFGGTGTESDLDIQPTQAPQKFESGNQDVAGILAMGRGIEHISTDDYQQQLIGLANQVADLRLGISNIGGIRLLGDFDPATDAPVVSFVADQIDCREFASILDASFGIQCRAGFHCAPLIHKYIGSGPTGTVRLSPGCSTTNDHIEFTINAIDQIASSF